MSKSSKRIYRLLLVITILWLSLTSGMGIVVYAKDITLETTGSVTFRPKAGDDIVTAASSFRMYRVAKLSGLMPLTFEFVAPFDQSGLDVNNLREAADVRSAAAVFEQYVAQVPAGESIIAASGGETVTGIPLGMYLVVNTSMGGNYSTPEPFMAIFPHVSSNDEWTVAYTAYPKTTAPDPDDPGGSDKKPGGQPISSVDPPSSPKNPVASVTPVIPATPPTMADVPDPLPPTSKNEPDLTLVELDQPDNSLAKPPLVPEIPAIPSGSAPQTGLLQWPVPVLSSLGLLLVCGGVLVKRGKNIEEQNDASLSQKS